MSQRVLSFGNEGIGGVLFISGYGFLYDWNELSIGTFRLVLFDFPTPFI